MIRSLVALVLFASLAAPVCAGTSLFEGSWAATLDRQGFTGTPTPFTGNASFLFDTGLLDPAAASQTFSPLPLLSYASSPAAFGPNGFSAATVFASLRAASGVVTGIDLGLIVAPGDAPGDVGAPDDFALIFSGASSAANPALLNTLIYFTSEGPAQSASFTTQGLSGAFVATAIPEPTAAGLLACGTALAGLARRRG